MNHRFPSGITAFALLEQIKRRLLCMPWIFMVPNRVFPPPSRSGLLFHIDAELPSEHQRRVVPEKGWNAVHSIVEVEGVGPRPFVDVDFDLEDFEMWVDGHSKSLEGGLLFRCIELFEFEQGTRLRLCMDIHPHD